MIEETSDVKKQAWERQAIEKLLLASVKEQRTKRRWGIFFKLLFAVYAGVVIFILGDFPSMIQGLLKPGGDGARHTALIDIRGTIDAEGDNSADKIGWALRTAFSDERTAGVILRINSPGGSPVQSGIIYDEIVRLRKKYPTKPLYAVVDDICASGGYYIAAAADKIYVNKASLVGSIGVRMSSFGFTGAMEKLGIERRLLTAGDNKALLDPFLPQDEKQKTHIQNLLTETHQQFIEAVRRGRGDRLKDSPEIFSGLIWTGSQSITLGLADDIGTVHSVAREVIQVGKIFDYSFKENLAERVAKRFGAEAGQSFGNKLMQNTALLP